MVTNLGGQLVDNIHNCTHLVTDKVGLHFVIFGQVILILKALSLFLFETIFRILNKQTGLLETGFITDK